MNFLQIILAVLATLAIAAPQRYDSPEDRYGSREVVPILRDDREQDDDGRYTVDVETGNGINIAQSGSPQGPEGAVVKAGQYS